MRRFWRTIDFKLLFPIMLVHAWLTIVDVDDDDNGDNNNDDDGRNDDYGDDDDDLN